MNRIRMFIALLALCAVATLIPQPAWGKQLWAKSFLGKPAPTFVVEKWLTPEPSREGKFVLIDFWATWCPPCREAIGELNELQQEFAGQLVVIGVSDETEEQVRALKTPKIKYAVAIDSQQRMKRTLEVRGIPHVILIDPKGIVRWEGFPLLDEDPLTPEVVRKVINRYKKEALATAARKG